MSEELEALIIAAIITLVPNIILKLLDKFKPRADVNKSSIEAADISLDMLKDALCSCRDEMARIQNSISELEKENANLKEENIRLIKLLNEIGGQNALRD